MTQFLTADEPLIVNGSPRLGHFSDALRELNRDAFVYENPFGVTQSGLDKWIGCKDFQYFGGMSDTLIFGCALAHLRYLAVAFVYVYDIETRQLWSRSWRSPLGLGLTLADNPREGESHFRIPALVNITMRYQDNPRQKSLLLKCKGLTIEARLDEQDFQPMALCTRTGYSGWTYANKSAGQALHGFIDWQGKRLDLGRMKAYGHHDFSCGYMRRETWWNWACFSGEIQQGARQGQRVGLNISTGVNETGFSENCFWLNGQWYPLNGAQFDFNSKDPLQPWQVFADDKKLQLSFTPMGLHREKIQAGYIASHFRQVFGEFTGFINLNGEAICLDGLKGFVEDQYIKW